MGALGSAWSAWGFFGGMFLLVPSEVVEGIEESGMQPPSPTRLPRKETTYSLSRLSRHYFRLPKRLKLLGWVWVGADDADADDADDAGEATGSFCSTHRAFRV